MLSEIWKDIKGYEGIYQVSNLGNVKSLNYNRSHKERLLKPTPTKRGCLIVELKSKAYQVHRLVAQTFIPNPNNLPQVNHIDENTSNNIVSNLEWCDAKYNSNHGTRNERIKQSHLKPVVQYNINNEYINTYPSIIEAHKLTGIDKSHISSCCNNKRKTAGGCKWVFAT